MSRKQELWKNWAVVVLPSLVVLLFGLLHGRLSGPTAGGISFLAVIGVAYLLFPKIKIDFLKLFVGVVIALLLVYAAALASIGQR